MNHFETPPSPEKRYFTAHGYECCIQMGPMSINGYIQLPDNHPWMEYDGTLETHPDIHVHGGITYHDGNVIGF